MNSENTNKFSRQIYDIMLAEYNRGQNFKWLNYIKQILISVGEPRLLNRNFIQNPKTTKEKIVNILNDLYNQEWATKLQSSSKGRNCSIFKENVKVESYFTTLPRNVYIPVVKFRTCNYKLPIETGRWHDVPLNERRCTLCNQNDLGDFHYSLKYGYFEVERKQLLKTYCYTRPNIIKFENLLTCNNKTVLTKLSKFMKIIMNKFSNET